MGDGTLRGWQEVTVGSRVWVAAVGLGLKATLLPQVVSGQRQRDTPEQAG